MSYLSGASPGSLVSGTDPRQPCSPPPDPPCRLRLLQLHPPLGLHGRPSLLLSFLVVSVEEHRTWGSKKMWSSKHCNSPHHRDHLYSSGFYWPHFTNEEIKLQGHKAALSTLTCPGNFFLSFAWSHPKHSFISKHTALSWCYFLPPKPI